jgi:hypothetical protein
MSGAAKSLAGLAIAALAWLAHGCADEPAPRGEAHAAAGGVAVHAPRIPAPAGDVAALYLVVTDQDGAGDRLLGVHTQVAEAQLHETLEQEGLVQMRRAQDGFAVPARGELRLEPGRAHVMLLGLREPLTPGARVRVTLEFERAGLLALEVPVVPAEQAGDVALGPPEPGAAPPR